VPLSWGDDYMPWTLDFNTYKDALIAAHNVGNPCLLEFIAMNLEPEPGPLLPKHLEDLSYQLRF